MFARLTGEDADSVSAQDKERLAASLGLLSYACDREGMHALLLENLKLVSPVRFGTLCEKAMMPLPPVHTPTTDARDGRSLHLPERDSCSTQSRRGMWRMAACCCLRRDVARGLPLLT